MGKNEQDPEEIRVKDFTKQELQVFTALLGICAVCVAACVLNNVWAMMGLLPVAVIVKNVTAGADEEE